MAFNDMSQMLVSDFVRDFKVNYPSASARVRPSTTFLQNDPNERLHVPQIVFIDRKGVIRHQSLPREDSITATETFMRKTIEELIAGTRRCNEQSGAAKKPAKKSVIRRSVSAYNRIEDCARSSARIERLPPEQKVRGSNPLGRTTFFSSPYLPLSSLAFEFTTLHSTRDFDFAVRRVSRFELLRSSSHSCKQVWNSGDSSSTLSSMQPLSTLGIASMVAQADVTRCGFFRPGICRLWCGRLWRRKAIVANCATRSAPRPIFPEAADQVPDQLWVYPTAKLRCTY